MTMMALNSAVRRDMMTLEVVDLASCTMLLKCTEGLRRRNRRLDTNSCPRARKRGEEKERNRKKDDLMLYCFV